MVSRSRLYCETAIKCDIKQVLEKYLPNSLMNDEGKFLWSYLKRLKMFYWEPPLEMHKTLMDFRDIYLRKYGILPMVNFPIDP